MIEQLWEYLCIVVQVYLNDTIVEVGFGVKGAHAF